ncbi:tetratricopeptide repeat protein [Azospirillum cavernae]|uniref:tetratricopeptide repeat protein n=1 Tax=Azospirillum cavernae TaxID=2320860 RepID=UPI0013142640|nr:tetratricopeptide repeat protein [Azospirillum cavernae]
MPEFTGRAAELLALTTALDRDSGATVAITALRGMGGVGKTTLAQHAARRLTHRYPDGQIVVDLNGHGVGAPTTPIDAMQRVIRAFTPTLPPLDDVAQARAIYRDTLTGKRVLILLDNAADTDQIRDLIPPPHCGALITARELVKPEGCTELRLDLLPLDESVELLRALAPTAAGKDADWRRLADRCGLLPLALRVAGSVLATAEDLTLPGYLAELADEATRPHRLTLDGDASANVAAVLSHSLRRLVAQDPVLAARWQILSVFPADFDRAAAAALWEESADSAARVLRGLLARSLLLFDETTRRYRLHDLMRPLARSLFERDPATDPSPGATNRLTAAEGRFAMHFMGVLAKADDLYRRGHDGVSAGLARYDAEARNIATAAAWAINRAESNSTAQQVAAQLPSVGNFILDIRLHPRVRIVWFTAANAAAHQMGNLRLAARNIESLGDAYADVGKTQRAIELHRCALDMFHRIGDPHGEAICLGSLGKRYASLGDSQSAIKHYQQALKLYQQITDTTHNISCQLGKAIQLANIGRSFADIGDTFLALNYYRESQDIAREIGYRRGESILLSNFGDTHSALGETEHATKLYQQALEIAREIGEQRVEGGILLRLANAHAQIGDVATAITLTEQALAIFVAIESPHADTARQQLARLREEAPQS